jgi:four helix bundle protein
LEYEVSFTDENLVIKEKGREYAVDLRRRLFNFAVDSIKFLMTLPHRKEFDVFRYQLSKSTTSMGANYEEAQGAFSQKEFASKIGICLKEAKESNYFYRIIQALNIGDKVECDRLTQESDELQKIFAAILIKVKSKK